MLEHFHLKEAVMAGVLSVCGCVRSDYVDLPLDKTSAAAIRTVTKSDVLALLDTPKDGMQFDGSEVACVAAESIKDSYSYSYIKARQDFEARAYRSVCGVTLDKRAVFYGTGAKVTGSKFLWTGENILYCVRVSPPVAFECPDGSTRTYENSGVIVEELKGRLVY